MIEPMNPEQAYVPGVCNINREEIAKRRKIGQIGLTFFIIFLVVMLFVPISRYLRILLFIPAFVAATGFLQARNKFCVGYAGAGMENASDGSQEAKTIADDDAKLKDKQKAMRMNIQCGLIALVVTVIVVVLPKL
jgi:hypothetical protein